MKFLPHFDAKLEYLVHRLDLQPNGTKAPRAENSDADTAGRSNLADFRSSKGSEPARLAKNSR